MQLKSRLTAAAVAGIVAAGSLAATLTSASPASADNHGGYGDRNGGHRDHRDDRRYVRGYAYPAPVYATPVYDYPVYPQPVYPVYGYGYPSRGYVHVSTPGFSLGVRL